MTVSDLFDTTLWLSSSMVDVPLSMKAITLDLLRDARETVRTSLLGVINTPMIPWCQTTLPLNIPCNIHIKLENMQRTGEFVYELDGLVRHIYITTVHVSINNVGCFVVDILIDMVDVGH